MTIDGLESCVASRLAKDDTRGIHYNVRVKRGIGYFFFHSAAGRAGAMYSQVRRHRHFRLPFRLTKRSLPIQALAYSRHRQFI